MLERYLCGILVEHVKAIMTNSINNYVANPPISTIVFHVENQEGFYPPVQLLARILASIMVNGL